MIVAAEAVVLYVLLRQAGVPEASALLCMAGLGCVIVGAVQMLR